MEFSNYIFFLTKQYFVKIVEYITCLIYGQKNLTNFEQYVTIFTLKRHITLKCIALIAMQCEKTLHLYYLYRMTRKPHIVKTASVYRRQNIIAGESIDSLINPFTLPVSSIYYGHTFSSFVMRKYLAVLKHCCPSL